MEAAAKPLLADFVFRRFARGGLPPTWFVCQPLGGAVAFLSYRLHARPYALTGASFVLGIIGCLVLAAADRGAIFAVAGVFLVLSYVFDCADGQLARATDDSTYRGSWLDVIADSVIVVALALAVLSQSRDDEWYAWSFVAALLLGGGRIAALFTATLARQSRGHVVWTSSGVSHLLRLAFLSIIDTPVVYLILALAGAAHLPLALPAAILGLGTMLHAGVIGGRRFPDEAELVAVETTAVR